METRRPDSQPYQATIRSTPASSPADRAHLGSNLVVDHAAARSARLAQPGCARSSTLGQDQGSAEAGVEPDTQEPEQPGSADWRSTSACQPHSAPLPSGLQPEHGPCPPVLWCE